MEIKSLIATEAVNTSREVAYERSTAFVAAAGSGGAIAFGLTANELAAIAGALVAVIGLVANLAVVIYYKQQHLNLARAVAKNGKPISDDE